MQISITLQEQKDLKTLTAPKGRTVWFQKNAGIGWASLQKLRTLGQADEEIVKKARRLLKSKVAQTLMEQDKEKELLMAS